MHPPNRDLLVLTKKITMNAKQLKQEVELLNELLFHVEDSYSFCTANEVIDVNRYKVITKPFKIQRAIRERGTRPFVFISNKN
ncbi:MAG TPA: hypothetical protein VHB48_09385 [Chitinophagaceae bacterium]|nr:hypothetical protein [Chitinophagaceae bacterium]